VRSLVQPQVMKAAAAGAAMTSLAGYPRLVFWSDRPHQLWFLALTLAWASFILWSFVFAWHSKFAQSPVFVVRADLRFVGIATGSGVLGALTLAFWMDPVLRPLVPDDYPATLGLWLAMTLFAVTFEQLFLCFAPFAFFLRLTRRPGIAGGLTVLFGVFLVYLQARARLGQVALFFVIELFAWRVVAGCLSLFFLVKGGALLTLWWVFLLQLRHLLHLGTPMN
jgi:hypothetical protein